MNDILYIAWQYLRYNWGKTAVLIASIALILFLPLGLQTIVSQGSEMLTARAESTPLLVGARGSAADLTLSALYFREPSVDPIRFGEVDSVEAGGLALAIPLHLRYQAGGRRIVGTSMEYFDFRGLTLAEGRRLALLGECLLGAEAARTLNATIGDAVISTPAGAFDVAGSYPLKMRVAGILAPAGTPDDEAIFVDIKTAWVIAGLAHGHEDVTAPTADTARILQREAANVIANASVLSYNEITPDNIASFHFHGAPATFPVDAILTIPNDFRSGVLLRGRMEAQTGSDVQIVEPLKVVKELLATVFSVRDLIVLGSLGVGLAALAIAILVFALSIRLRRREIETIRKIGGPRRQVNAILGAEVVIVLGAAVLIALTLTLFVRQYGEALLRWIS